MTKTVECKLDGTQRVFTVRSKRWERDWEKKIAQDETIYEQWVKLARTSVILEDKIGDYELYRNCYHGGLLLLFKGQAVDYNDDVVFHKELAVGVWEHLMKPHLFLSKQAFKKALLSEK